MAATHSQSPPPKKRGARSLAGQEQRLAYILLIPTFIILFAVAVYPLLSVFYYSFTDAKLASSEEPQVVGFENYVDLLSMTIRELPPEIDEETGEVVIDPDTGEIDYQLSLNVLPREPRRFREYSQFHFNGTQYVVGATEPAFIHSFVDTFKFTIGAVSF